MGQCGCDWVSVSMSLCVWLTAVNDVDPHTSRANILTELLTFYSGTQLDENTFAFALHTVSKIRCETRLKLPVGEHFRPHLNWIFVSTASASQLRHSPTHPLTHPHTAAATHSPHCISAVALFIVFYVMPDVILHKLQSPLCTLSLSLFVSSKKLQIKRIGGGAELTLEFQ